MAGEPSARSNPLGGRLGVRGKLFVVALSLFMGVGLISGTYLEYSLRSWLENRAESDLWRLGRTARDFIETAPGPSGTESLTHLATRLAESTGARVTIITPVGELLADSQLHDHGMSGTENHLGREEVQGALSHGRGMSRRFSHTVGAAMLYCALPFSRTDVQGVVRVAMSLGLVEDAVHKLRLILAAAGLVGLGAALFISGLASHFASRALRQLVDHAERVGRGYSGSWRSAWPEDAVTERDGSFSHVARNMQRVVNILGHERDQFAAVLDSMNEAVLTLDANNRVTLINGAAIEILGCRAQPLGNDLLDTVESAELREIVARAADGEPVREELTLGKFRVLARATPLAASGETVVVLHDITDLRRLEQVRSDFVANVSHELRTPVSIIRANAETLLDGALDDPKLARPFMEALLRNAERLGRIIADLLDISRVEAGQLRLRSQVVEIGAAARRAVDVMQPAAARKNIALGVHMDTNLQVLGDAHALDQVLVNLLDNAVKYTPEGGTIDVRAEHTHGGICVRVMDDGPGIALEHQERVFERFYRIDPGRSRDMGGTGLGLSIVKHLCESMGGRAGVEQRQPRGSVFWFSLPSAAQQAA